MLCHEWPLDANLTDLPGVSGLDNWVMGGRKLQIVVSGYALTHFKLQPSIFKKTTSPMLNFPFSYSNFYLSCKKQFWMELKTKSIILSLGEKCGWVLTVTEVEETAALCRVLKSRIHRGWAWATPEKESLISLQWTSMLSAQEWPQHMHRLSQSPCTPFLPPPKKNPP